jgi:hypothetical protein
MMEKLRICNGSVAEGLGARSNGMAGMSADQPIWVNYLARETAFAIADFLFAA